MSPYIPPERRTELNAPVNDFPKNPGELNYVLTAHVVDYLKDPESGPLNYEKYNAVMGVLTCIQHELYRRKIADHENRAIERNGDVF